MNRNSYPQALISQKAEKSVAGGHPWIYGSEITGWNGEAVSGQLADVFNQKQRWLGTGFYNQQSKIAIRLLTRNPNDTVNDAFWLRRCQYAWQYRQTALSQAELSCCRLVHGEADQLPGLTVDRYEDILIVQILSLGMDLVKDTVLTQLRSVLQADGVNISGIYLRNDSAIRQLEGLDQTCGWYWRQDGCMQASGIVRIRENGLLFDIDVANGQKTGYFLDQKRNRASCGLVAGGHNVLDCFCNVGGFALNCAKNGAASVTAVDISPAALEQGRHNATLNSLDKVSFEQADVFELLKKLADSHSRQYDMIILDPPAFTKARSSIAKAEYGYYEINRLAMKILPRGGWLITCSCSHFMNPARYKALLQKAAASVNVSLRQAACFQQSPDHPILWNVPETEYLQFYIFQII